MSSTDERTQQAGWTRRGVLAVLVTVPLAGAGPAQGLHLPPQLADICRRAVADPLQLQLGTAVAAGHHESDLVTGLLDLLGPQAMGDWNAALVRSGKRDIDAGNTIEVEDIALMRTEAYVLAIGSFLHAATGKISRDAHGRQDRFS